MSWLLLSTLLSASPALADDAPPEDELPGDESVPDLEPTPGAVYVPMRSPVHWALWLAPDLGLAIPMGHPGIGSGLGVAAGARAPWLEGRLLAGFRVGISGWSVNDQLTDPALAAPYDWHLTVRRLTLSPLVVGRLKPAGMLSPELGLGLDLNRGVFQTSGAVAGEALGGSWELASWTGWAVEAAVAAPIGPVEGRVSVGWHGEHLAASATGDARVGTLVFGVSARVMP